MAHFRTLPTPPYDLLPRLMVEVCLVLAPDVNSSLIHANRGYLVSVVFPFLFFFFFFLFFGWRRPAIN